MIQIQNLSKTFRVHKKDPGLKGSIQALFRRQWVEKQALKNVSLSVGAGEIVGLIGANGAGKTTLVKTLAGIIHPTSGNAQVLGFIPWARENEFRKQIALIMGQKAQLWWDLPAADCFLLLREIYRIPKPQFERTLAHLTQILGVKDQLNIQIRRLSLGERMKMELIAALLHQPKVVFLDEPTIGLDLTAQKAIRDFLLQYREEHEPAMILTSHYMEDIERLCKRIVIIREGELVYDGPLERIVRDFAVHKVITAQLSQAMMLNPESLNFPSELGEMIVDSGTLGKNTEIIRFKVPRGKISDAAATVLKSFPVIDLDIEEEAIGDIIERIMKGKSG